jgi:hypothetical protein
MALQELEHLKALAIIMTLVVFLTVVMTFVLLKRVTEALSITKVHQFLTLQDINSIFLDVLVSLFYGMRFYLKNLRPKVE